MVNRILLGLAIPVGVSLFTAIIIFGFSQVLLMTGDQALSTTIAIVVATIILAAGFVLAGKPQRA